MLLFGGGWGNHAFTQRDYSLLEPGQWFRTWEFSVPFSQSIGDFGETSFGTGPQGFARAGSGFNFGISMQRRGSLVDVGFALEWQSLWQGVRHQDLLPEMETAYNVPDAFATDLQRERRTWRTFTYTFGPTLSLNGGPVEVEGRFLIGRLGTRNPRYGLVDGNYVAPGYERFLMSRDTETRASRRRWNWAVNPSLTLRFPFHDWGGFKVTGSWMRGTMNQEMEVFQAYETPNGFAFQRTQNSFSHTIEMWTIGIGVYARVATLFDND